MAKLIDKDALVAEIERRMKNLTHEMSKFYFAINYNEWKFAVNEYKSLMSFINTLDVTNVDLEKEIQNVIHNHFFDLNGIAIAGTSSYATVDDMVYIAKYFFELGLKTKDKVI